MTTTLIVPGLNSSGAAHWQTWFESRLTDAVRVVQPDWKRADLPQWTSRLRREISRQKGRVVIAAHSFGVLAAVQAADDYRERIAGALFVAPADPDKFGLTDHLPTGALGFPSVLVASLNDPWLSFDGAARLAARWGSELVDLGAAGHINAETGYGPWPYGLALLQQLDPGVTTRPVHLGVSHGPYRSHNANDTPVAAFTPYREAAPANNARTNFRASFAHDARARLENNSLLKIRKWVGERA